MSRKLLVLCAVFLFTAVFAVSKNIADVYPELDIKNDENLMFLPTYCFYDKKTNTYHIRFHAWVYEPETSSKKRKMLISFISNILDIDESKIAESNFEKTAQYLLYDNESHKWVSAGYGGDQYNLGLTDKTGHTERELVLPPEIFKKGLPADTDMNDFMLLPSWVNFRAGTTHKKGRFFEGKARYMPPDGVIIVSDIDDTIKITNVGDKKKMMENTFLNPYVPVEGMPGLYRSWETEGADFIYLSASPWQLYEPLAGFLEKEEFPSGVMEMKIIDLPSDVKSMFDGPEKVKIPALKKMFKSFPDRKFILIGDSGEQDPEIYGRIAAEYKDRIAWILIRNVNDETPDSKRMNDALKGFPRERFRLFKNPAELNFINISDIR